MKNDGTVIMALLLIPADHEFMPISAISNGGIVHGTEGFAIFKGFIHALLSMNTGQLQDIRLRSPEVILRNHFVAFEDTLDGFGGIKWQQRIWRCAGELAWESGEE